MREWWEGAYLGGSKVRVEEVRDEVSFSSRYKRREEGLSGERETR